MKLKRSDIQLTRIYNDRNTDYLNDLQETSQKTEGEKQGGFVIPKVMYDKNKEFYQNEIIKRNHQLIIINTVNFLRFLYIYE